MSTKRVVPVKKDQTKRPPSRSRLVFDTPHIFRMKSERSLAHLQENRDFIPCIACSKEFERRQETFTRPHSSYSRQRSTPPPSSCEQRPSTATKKKSSPLPPTPADLERLSRPKTAQPERLSNNCNWNNFIKKRSKYGMKKFSFEVQNRATNVPSIALITKRLYTSFVL
jgi:hypothetical protein